MAFPVIGITAKGPGSSGAYALSARYVRAVRRAKGAAVVLPAAKEVAGDLVARIDGLILSGGGDVDPSLYGGVVREEVYGVNRERDEFEIALVRAALERNLPVLGICRGCQLINVALGGTLIEHLPEGEGGVRHRASESESARHPVAAWGRLAGILGCGEIEPVSYHHQAVRQPAPGLEVVARAPDGVVEALEMPGHPWLFAVQWHPEITAGEDRAQQRLFDALVKAARERTGLEQPVVRAGGAEERARLE